jgi:WXG100 protein secretion system (Wss), protein YukD
MPAPGMPAASAITVRHPEGSIRVSAPTDVPLSELLLDLVELAGLPGHQDWVLGPLDGPPYAPDRTLAQLGVDDGALLALRELRGDGSAAGGSPTTERMIARPPLGATPDAGGRPLSDRSARILPIRLSIPARCMSVLGALARPGRVEQHCDRESGALGPAGFTRPPRLSPLSRVRKAWAHGDYRQRLEQAIAAPRLQRCVTIAIVSPKGGVFWS